MTDEQTPVTGGEDHARTGPQETAFAVGDDTATGPEAIDLIALQTRDASLNLGQLFLAMLQIAIDNIRLARDVDEFILQLDQLCLQIVLRLFDGGRTDITQHKKQND